MRYHHEKLTVQENQNKIGFMQTLDIANSFYTTKQFTLLTFIVELNRKAMKTMKMTKMYHFRIMCCKGMS